VSTPLNVTGLLSGLSERLDNVADKLGALPTVQAIFEFSQVSRRHGRVLSSWSALLPGQITVLVGRSVLVDHPGHECGEQNREPAEHHECE
jgi:hypothetical protein